LSQALLRALARELGHVLSARHTERLRVFAARGTSGRRLELGNECEASLHFDRLRLTRGQSRTLRDPVVYGREEQGAVRWSAWEIRWRSEPAGQSERRSTVTWIPREAGAVRQPEPGDRLLPLGGVGRRPVRRLLMEARVPRPERETYPVVLHRGEIVWLPGVCRAAVAVPPRGEPSLRLEARRIGAAGSMAGVTRSADWKNDDGP
jgi:tRNA(Ile)-lysidine synthetase-like protein